MKPCRPSVLVPALLALACSAPAQVIVNISDPNCVFPTFPSLSADGTTACSQDSCGPFTWDGVFGVQRLTTQIAETRGINANGAIVVGLTPPPNYRPARILPGNVFHDLGIPPGLQLGYPFDISHSGSVVVGWGQQNSSPFTDRGFRWDNGVYSLLPLPAGEGISYAYCISGDASAVFGFTYPPPTFSQSLTRWRTGFPIERFGAFTFPTSTAMGVTAANPNGTFAVGHTQGNGFDVQGWLWSQADGFVELTVPPGTTQSRPGGLTADGAAVVGQIGSLFTFYRAGYWTETHGWTRLDEYLPTVGVNLTGWELRDCLGISDDGTVLVGRGVHNGVDANWLVRDIPPLCAPRIDLSPHDTIGCAHASSGLSVYASGPNSLAIISFQWYRRVLIGTGYVDIVLTNGATGNGSTISGAQTQFLTWTNLSPADAGEYFCTISGGCGSNSTALVILNVKPDVNGDGVVDGADLSVLLANFGEPVAPYTSGDYNGDGFVDGADLSTLLSNFGDVCD